MGHLKGIEMEHGKPKWIRCDNGPEFRGKAMQRYLERERVKVHYIEVGKTVSERV